MDSIWAVMIVWRLGGKRIRTVLCCIVYDSCAQWYTQTCEPFIHLHVYRFRFHFLRVCLGLVFFLLFYVSSSHFSCVACFYCVGFSFFGNKPSDRLGSTFPKWPVLCRMGLKNSTQSINQSIVMRCDVSLSIFRHQNKNSKCCPTRCLSCDTIRAIRVSCCWGS